MNPGFGVAAVMGALTARNRRIKELPENISEDADQQYKLYREMRAMIIEYTNAVRIDQSVTV